MAQLPDKIVFDKSGYFYEMVATFDVAVAGLQSIFDPANPMKFKRNNMFSMEGLVHKQLLIDQYELHQQAAWENIQTPTIINNLTCMLVNTSYEAVSDKNHHSPLFEFFRHMRNAASHRNHLNFFPQEPKRPAAWRTKIIDDALKGTANPLYGHQCFGNFINAADAILLLWDIEQIVGPAPTVPTQQDLGTCWNVDKMAFLPQDVQKLAKNTIEAGHREIVVCDVPQVSPDEWKAFNPSRNDPRQLLAEHGFNFQLAAMESMTVTLPDTRVPIVIFINSNRVPNSLKAQLISRDLARVLLKIGGWKKPMSQDPRVFYISGVATDAAVEIVLRKNGLNLEQYNAYHANINLENLKKGYDSFVPASIPSAEKDVCAATMIARSLILANCSDDEAGATLSLLPADVSSLARSFFEILKTAASIPDYQSAIIEMAKVTGIEPSALNWP